MSNSSLICYTKLSPHCEPRTDTIRKITIHHMAGNLSVETCGNVFNGTRSASSNYGIGSDGRIGMYVPEDKRAYTSANKENDNQAVTIEVANDGKADTDWHVSEKAIESLINLCVDICKRNGIERLNYTGDKNGNLTRHNMFMATTCPGPYLQNKFSFIAEEVNKRLKTVPEEPKEDPKVLLPLDEIAREVIAGKWGNGQERFNRLEHAGYNSSEVQNRVNELVKASKPANTFNVGDNVKIVGTGNSQASGKGGIAKGINYCRRILKVYKGSAFPYMVGNEYGVTGFYKAESLQKI